MLDIRDYAEFCKWLALQCLNTPNDGEALDVFACEVLKRLEALGVVENYKGRVWRLPGKGGENDG